MFRAFLLILLAFSVNSSVAQTYSLPIQLDYVLINKVISQQLSEGYAGNKVWQDGHGCSSLALDDLKVGGKQGHIALQNTVHAEIGAKLGGHCMPLLKWNGILQTLQQPSLSADHKRLSLPIVSATAYDQQGRQINIGQVQQLLNNVIQSKFAGLTLDLTKQQADMEHTLASYLPTQTMAEVKTALATLTLSDIKASDDNLALTLNFDAPKPALTASQALSPEEQQQWQTLWQQWDSVFVQAIDQAAVDTGSSELRDTLTEILLDSRRSFQTALTQTHSTEQDPVRAFFMTSWEKLAPHLRTAAKQLPALKSLNYLTFIAATDVIYQLENLGAPFGLSVTSDGLQKLARMLIVTKPQQLS
ncbi:hypothetical protein [Methylocucumis oryzae]|uniref:Uncharacterized protein n=1 Tax=Methylocucumis oryzae TaxID=1632867 RepID=A0A0F3IIQ0_9GAMM|nr:hypothetical protein [Methylocucumis oryzae]KJV06650.1 hypothetical protein VZ94_09910 [Methylocucumis oryzae]